MYFLLSVYTYVDTPFASVDVVFCVFGANIVIIVLGTSKAKLTPNALLEARMSSSVNFVLSTEEDFVVSSNILAVHSAFKLGIFTSCATGAGNTLKAFLVLILYSNSGLNEFG